MGQRALGKEQQLFMHLMGTFQSNAWIALSKMKNPMTDKIGRNLEQASYYYRFAGYAPVKNER